MQCNKHLSNVILQFDASENVSFINTCFTDSNQQRAYSRHLCVCVCVCVRVCVFVMGEIGKNGGE